MTCAGGSPVALRCGDVFAERVNAAADLLDAGVPAAEAARSWPAGSAARRGRRTATCERAAPVRACGGARPGRGVHRQAAGAARRRGCGRMPPRRAARSPRWSRRRWRSSWRGRIESARAGERAGGRDRVRLRPPAGRGTVGGLPHPCPRTTARAACAPVRKRAVPMSNAAIYARVSSARQKEQETIGSQTAALRAHAEQLGLDVPEQWVFEDDGHSGASLVRPALERLRDLVCQVPVDVLLVLLAGPAGPQVRLPGAADRGVRQGRHHAWCSSRARAATAPRTQLLVQFQGMIAEYETRPDPGTDPPRQDPPGQGRHGQRALRAPRSATATSARASTPSARYEIVAHEAAIVAELFAPLRRRRGRDRRAGPLADRPGRADPHRQDPLGPLGGLGHAAQPRLRRAGLLRQDDAHRTDRRAQPHRPAGRARHAPALHGHRPAPRGLARDPRPRAGRRGHLAAGPAAAGRQQALRLPQQQESLAAARPVRLRRLRLRLLPHLDPHHQQEDLLLPLPRLGRLPLRARPGLRQQAGPRRLPRHRRLGPHHRPARRPGPDPHRDQQAARRRPAPPTPPPPTPTSRHRRWPRPPRRSPGSSAPTRSS